MIKQLILYCFHFKKFFKDCENEFGNTMFGNYQLCRKFDVVLNINQTNKRNENGLLIGSPATGNAYNALRQSQKIQMKKKKNKKIFNIRGKIIYSSVR